MGRLNLAILAFIVVLGFILRLYRFDSPIGDWHQWRQADTSSVSRNFVNSGFDFLHPKFDDLSNVASGLDNPQGYRFVEFPIYNFFQAFFYKAFGLFSLEEWGRMVTIISSSISSILIFLIVRKKASELAGLVSAGLFALLPFSIYYGRVILPDPMMVTSILGGIYFFDLFLSKQKNKWVFFFLSAILTASSLLLKPYAIFFTLPMIYLSYEKFGINFFKKWFLWAFLLISIIPLVLWRNWIMQFPQGIPASDWLFNQGNIRFKASFFYWIFADRISRLILGYFGVVFLFLGFLSKVKKENFLFFLSFVLSSLIYLTVMAAGNVQHDYYQILILPTIAIMGGLGAEYLLKSEARMEIKYLLFVVISSFTFLFGWYHVRDYFNINNPSIVTAGKIIDEMVPKDAKIIAEYEGDTAFLYQTKRKGWASLQSDLPRMRGMGADYLALVNPTPSDYFFEKDYEIVYESDELLLYDLSTQE